MKHFISLALSLMTVLLLTSVCLAGDSVTLAVSCTIPAIPGVNAPPFEKAITTPSQDSTTETPYTTTTQESTVAQRQETTQSTMIQEDVEVQETLTADNMITRTVYSR